MPYSLHGFFHGDDIYRSNLGVLVLLTITPIKSIVAEC